MPQISAKVNEDPSLQEILNSYEQECHEQKSNLIGLTKAAGRVVDCGDVVQLLHNRSKLFLSMLKSRAVMEDSAMRLELLENGCALRLATTTSFLTFAGTSILSGHYCLATEQASEARSVRMVSQ